MMTTLRKGITTFVWTGFMTVVAIGLAASPAWSEAIPVPVDIKPQSCPNPLNVKGQGVLPVAILGTANLDVTEVDPASIRLEGVSPLRSNIKDVATPFDDSLATCSDCTDQGRDGFDDLTLHFNAQDVVAAISPVTDGECLMLQLTGNLFDGTPIQGEDVMVILKRGSLTPSAGSRGSRQK